jgi:hypothetical protein
VNVESEAKVSEISSMSIIRVYEVHDRMSLMFIPSCHIGASSCWCLTQ